MSAQSVKFFVSSPVARPLDAAWTQSLSNWLARAGHAVLRECEIIGRARARSELQRMARLHADCPEFARVLHNAIQSDGPRA
jgi:hypothetical protein